jgi:transcriptional regulator with XRE-family HTH domain
VRDQGLNLRLKTRILELFGTQFNVARALGMSEDRLSRIVHGRKEPTPEERKAICRILNVKQEDIF